MSPCWTYPFLQSPEPQVKIRRASSFNHWSKSPSIGTHRLQLKPLKFDSLCDCLFRALCWRLFHVVKADSRQVQRSVYGHDCSGNPSWRPNVGQNFYPVPNLHDTSINHGGQVRPLGVVLRRH